MKVVNMNEKRIAFVKVARDFLGEDRTVISRPEMVVIAGMLGGATVLTLWARAPHRKRAMRHGLIFIPS